MQSFTNKDDDNNNNNNNNFFFNTRRARIFFFFFEVRAFIVKVLKILVFSTSKNYFIYFITLLYMVSYGDETFCHNMSLFRYQKHMVMKLHLSPKPGHRMS